MYYDIINNYIKKLNKDDLKKFAKKKNISYSEKELDIVYNFIINNYQELLKEKIEVFKTIKDKINPTLYKQLLELYIEYKQKYL